jgi:hypothetical protein
MSEHKLPKRKRQLDFEIETTSTDILIVVDGGRIAKRGQGTGKRTPSLPRQPRAARCRPEEIRGKIYQRARWGPYQCIRKDYESGR